MTKRYPTEEEILAERPKFKEGLVLIVNLWKATSMKNWQKDPKWVKIEYLSLLIQAICCLYHKSEPKIMITHEYACDIKRREIFVDISHPSIISTLHETAHYLFGESELGACRWSIWLFKECFPKSYNNLVFDGHLLVKK